MSAVPLVLSLGSLARHAHHASRASHAAPTAPPVADALGWLAGAIGIATGWPQAWRLWAGRRHEGLSLTSSVLAVLYCTAWLLYGAANHSLVQVASNVLGLIGLVVILAGHVMLARPAVRQWLPLLVGGVALLLVVASLGARPLGLTASAATISGVLPQAVSLARARRAGDCDASGVSRSRWTMSFVANLLWVSYGLIVGDPVIVGNSSVIALLGAAIVVLAAEARPTLEDELLVQAELAIAA